MTEPRDYDVIVVGSGAGGGMAAYVLTQRGLNVLLLEAGRDYDPTRETPMFNVEADAPLNGAATPDKQLGFYDATVDGGWEIPGEPYTAAPGTEFRWWRSRMLGGRTNHWTRITQRYGPYDFRTYTREGIGVDWPISYDDVAPYYDRVEKLIGVFGAAEGIENSPDSPAGVLLPPPSLRAHELWAQKVLEKRLGIRTVPNHVAVLTQPLNGRQACLYATPCIRGCSIRANFQTPTVLLPSARATGRLEIRTSAMAYEVPLDPRACAAGVRYIDKRTGTHHFARGRAVVLAASAGETARILLNSRSSTFPDGLANSSGQVGRNLTDSMPSVVSGDIPALQGLSPFNDDGVVGVTHAVVPWWGHRDRAAGRLRFGTEYHIDMFGGRSMPTVSSLKVPFENGKPLYGQGLRKRLRAGFGGKIMLGAWGGVIPNSDCRCELDPAIKDRWGIPVLRFHWKAGAQEREQNRHAVASMSEMISAMGGKPMVNLDGSLANAGGGFHEVGTARMGVKPADSVLNSFSHAWDVRNLYVADGANFAGQADKYPTHTIMALAWRASEHLADSFVRKEI